MNYIWTIGDKEYNLKFTTSTTVETEQRLGCSLLSIFNNRGQVPQLKTMAIIIQGAMKWKHELSLNQIYSLFDEYMEEGKTFYDILSVISDTYMASGIIRKPTKEELEKAGIEEESLKNLMTEA